MRIAVCFAGQLRTGVVCEPNIKRFFGSYLQDCDFFIHTWYNVSFKNDRAELFKSVNLPYFQDFKLPPEKIDEFVKLYNAKSFLVEDLNDKKIEVGYHQIYSIDNVFKQVYNYQINNNFQYDVIFKIRPDAFYPSDRCIQKELDNYFLNTECLYSDYYHPEGIDDVFWIFNSENLKKLINFYNDYCYIIDSKNFDHAYNRPLLSLLKTKGIKNLSTEYKNGHPYMIYRYEFWPFDPMTQFGQMSNVDKLLIEESKRKYVWNNMLK